MEVGILLRRAPDDKGKPTALPEHPMKAHKRYGPTRKELHSIATDYRIPTAIREREACAIHHLYVDVIEPRPPHLADGLFHHLRRGVDGKHVTCGAHAFSRQQGNITGSGSYVEDLAPQTQPGGVQHPRRSFGQERRPDAGPPFPGDHDVALLKRLVRRAHPDSIA